MSETAQSLSEIAQAIASKDELSRGQMADQLTDLFVAHADAFGEEHVALFDQIIGMLAYAIELRARVRLAEKLADVSNAPTGVVRRLAKDEISVARPVLSRSPRLTDADLIAAARARGRDHMLAISERTNLSEPVTDVLIAEGDRVVVNAVASNPTARFSDQSYDSLVAFAESDALLHSVIARRQDIPPRHMTALFDLAKNAARERLQSELSQTNRRAVRDAVNSSARDMAEDLLAQQPNFDEAMKKVTDLFEKGRLDASMLADMARRSEAEQTVCGLSLLAQVQLGLAERAVMRGDHDLLLTIAKSADFDWDVVRLILSIRRDRKPGPRQFELLAGSYSRLTAPTAQRLLRYLQAREAVSAAAISVGRT